MAPQNHYLWQIDEAFLPELHERLRSNKPAFVEEKLPARFQNLVNQAKMDIASAWNGYFAERYSPDPSVLVLPVSGSLSRETYWNFGNEFFMRQLASADQDERFKGVVLSIHSPGGTADSTLAFANAVAAMHKPIVVSTAYCASAAYFVASQADEIVMEDQAASQIGSIGTLLIYENWVKHLEQEGIKMEILRAKGSEDKARVNWMEELPDDARAELQSLLDACQREFAGAVKRGRAGKLTSSEALTGKMYGTAQALKMGLADRKGTLSDAVKRVLQLNQK